MKGPVNTNYKADVLNERHEQKLIEKLSKRMHVKLKKSKSYEKLTSFVLRRSSSLRTNIGRRPADFFCIKLWNYCGEEIILQAVLCIHQNTIKTPPRCHYNKTKAKKEIGVQRTKTCMK